MPTAHPAGCELQAAVKAAYVIADITVLNSELYEDYRRQVPAVVEKYGGRYLVRGGASEVLEGEWKPNNQIA